MATMKKASNIVLEIMEQVEFSHTAREVIYQYNYFGKLFDNI